MKSEKQLDSSLASSVRHARRRYLSRPTALLNKFPRQTALMILIVVGAYGLGYASNHFFSETAVDLGHHTDFSEHHCADAVSPSAVRRTIHERVFNGKSPWENFPPPHVARILDRQWTKGWGSNASVFEHLITQVQPKTIIEVGTFLGASAIHMAELTKKLGLDTQIICINDFRGWPGWHDEGKSIKMVNGDSLLLYQFMQNVVTANAMESIVYLPFSTSIALSELCLWGVYGDLVEIDGAHDFHSAWVDINNGFKVLRPRGVLFGHDIVWEGVRKAVDLFAKIHGFRVKIDGEHWILY